MKRLIICTNCAQKMYLRYPNPPDTPHPLEHIKFVEGRAIEAYICDHCATSIKALAKCTAVSIWSDIGAAPYFPWEMDSLCGIKDNDFN